MTFVHHELQEIEQRPLGPMDVVDQHHQRTPLGRDLQRAPDRPERLLGRERLLDQADRRSDALGDVLVAGEHRAELDACGLQAVVGPDAGGGADHLADRPVRHALPVGETPALERGGVAPDAFEELLEQTGLPDTGRSEDRHDVASRLRTAAWNAS